MSCYAAQTLDACGSKLTPKQLEVEVKLKSSELGCGCHPRLELAPRLRGLLQVGTGREEARQAGGHLWYMGGAAVDGLGHVGGFRRLKIR